MIDSILKCAMKLFIHFQSSTVSEIKDGRRKVTFDMDEL